MFGDDGRYYESEAAWEYAYNEGCKEEMRRIYAAEADDCADYDEDHSVPGGVPTNEDIPF